ncbi:hypothetical protein YH66_11310 [[Brevibacterium] flavum]|uniref:Uncharacterized protein n=1 Tax=[Brevibacterium] flavum TaxID=92706 RepID=A0A0F6WRA6_9CORY|nr:hypothetical protein [Corynebacterium glutamicum]AKF28098.1 hypothetical protein YH66_11310 [[Brevibacterium] flavum]AST21339.1 hypothetical protein CEY17_11475 [Corynebacterium glutamicum ATCC 14067]ANE08930.1 hypothetical protein A3654_11385 [Corynebacterium glutamicum]KEI23862.1 hypothetical protein KIQ_015270 [Corynebacterium glutamicum ATCC 14067]KIH72899.1 hypothetical protein SD36_11370 [Corynebacterium glutamicum]
MPPSFFSRRRKNEPDLLALPAQIRDIRSEVLDIFMAESLVIINIDEKSAELLIDAARHHIPTRFTGPNARPLSVIPIEDPRSRPTLHPDHGWMLPLSPPVVDELLGGGLKIGETELESINIAFIVDAS